MTTVSSPVQIGAKTSNSNVITKIVTTSSGTTAMLDDYGRVYTLGSGEAGALGDGTTINKSTPTYVPISLNPSFVTVIEAGYRNFAVVANNNQTLYSWGDNSSYQIGDGTTIAKSSPVALSIRKTTEYPWKSIENSGNHTLGIRVTDGSLWAWGYNSVGQLGDGTTINKSTPTKIGNKSWSIISTQGNHSAGITTDGALMVVTAAVHSVQFHIFAAPLFRASQLRSLKKVNGLPKMA